MGLLNKKNINKLANNWPNPYSLDKDDQWGYLDKMPLEIMTLAILEMKKQYPYRELEDLKNTGIRTMFYWSKTEDGWEFWNEIDKKNYDVFYAIYTPEKLRELLKRNKIL